MVPTFKPWEELTISDNYIFQLVMREPKLCKHLLEKILQIDIQEIRFLDNEKTLDAGLEHKSIRLDVYVKDNAGRTYDIEMQCASQGRRNLVKRAFIYQSMIAVNQLKKGIRYEKLNPQYVIFICTFDVFGKGLPMYWIESSVRQNRDIMIEDEAHRIFLNSKAADYEKDVEIADFLRYVNGQEASEKFTREIDCAVRMIKAEEGRRLQYMLFTQEIQWMKEDSFAEGEAKGKAEGKAEEKQQTAAKFLQLGVPLETIAAGTGLPLEEIQAMLKEKK